MLIQFTNAYMRHYGVIIKCLYLTEIWIEQRAQNYPPSNSYSGVRMA